MTRTVTTNGVVTVGYQQVCVGQHYSGSPCNVLVTDRVLQFWVGNQLLKTVADVQEEAGKSSPWDWVTTMATAQANFTRDIAEASEHILQDRAAA